MFPIDRWSNSSGSSETEQERTSVHLFASEHPAGLQAEREVTRRRGRGRVCVFADFRGGGVQTEKTPNPPGTRPPVPEDEGRVEGLKSSSSGRRKVGEAVMQKPDMETGRGAGAGLTGAKVTEDE